MKTIRLLTLFLTLVSTVSNAQNYYGTAPLVIEDDSIFWGSFVYDRDYLDCQNDSDARENVSRLLRIDPKYIDSVTILKDSAAIAVWGPRAKYGAIEVSFNERSRENRFSRTLRHIPIIRAFQSFVEDIHHNRIQTLWDKKANPMARIEVSGKEPGKSDAVLIEVRDENGPIQAQVSLPGNKKHAFKTVGRTDVNGRIAFHAETRRERIRVGCSGYYDVELPIEGTKIEITLAKNPSIDEADIAWFKRTDDIRYDDNEITVSGDKPRSGDTITGQVYVGRNAVSGKCRIAEINAEGKVIAKTVTDSNGSFSLRVKNPGDLLFIDCGIRDTNVSVIEINGSRFIIKLAGQVQLRG